MFSVCDYNDRNKNNTKVL